MSNTGFFAFNLIIILLVAFAPMAGAKVLEGSITKSGEGTRLSRPSTGVNEPLSDSGPPVAPPRLSRPAQPMTGLVDTSSFNGMSGNARQDAMRLGAVKAEDFNLPRGFDLGTERGSRELTLAWEKWHKQLSQIIYERWSAIADEPGRATVRVTVNRNRQIQVAIISSDGSGRFDRKLRTVIEGLSGNPGLTFPAKSQRPMVSFEADYIAAHNVTPGYSWVKGDYEKVREQY